MHEGKTFEFRSPPEVPSPAAPPELDQIYAPIRAELGLLGEFLDAELASSEPFIHAILQHVARFRGKQIRPALLFLMNRLGGGQVSPDVVKIAAVLEMVHTATLVHDDLLDDALLRRQLETVHVRWGDRPAVLAGDSIYSRAFELSTEVDGMASILAKTTNAICEGELLQIGHRHVAEMGEDVYFEIIRKKTAILHAVACEIGGRFAGLSAADQAKLHGFGMDLGMAFQIIDDCLDYSGSESVVGKSLGTDLRQGKVTLPLLYLREQANSAERARIEASLRGPMSADDERAIRALVRERGVLAEALARANGFVERARSLLDAIACERVDPGARRSLELAAAYVLRRQR
jgi:octaprenyl-diphosphate synthase